jgi:hypothetical protein
LFCRRKKRILIDALVFFAGSNPDVAIAECSTACHMQTIHQTFGSVDGKEAIKALKDISII